MTFSDTQMTTRVRVYGVQEHMECNNINKEDKDKKVMLPHPPLQRNVGFIGIKNIVRTTKHGQAGDDEVDAFQNPDKARASSETR